MAVSEYFRYGTQSDPESISDDEMELDFGDDAFAPVQNQPPPPPPIARRQFPWGGHQQVTGANPLAAMMGMRMDGAAGMGGMLGGYGTGFQPSAGVFRRNYNAYSMAILEVQQGRGGYSGRENAMYGGKSAFLPILVRHCFALTGHSHYAGVCLGNSQ
jgi:hypothetical protein